MGEMSKMSKMRLYIQTKNLSGGWQTVASFTNQVEAAGAYLHVFRDYNTGVRLVEKSIRRAGKGTARQGRHSGLDPIGAVECQGAELSRSRSSSARANF